MMKNMKLHKKTALGLLIGGAVGSTLAFLFAPKPGRELRADIKEGLGKSMEKVKDSGGKIVSGTKTVSGGLMSKLQSALTAGMDTFRAEKQKSNVRIPSIDAAIRESENTPHGGIPAEGPVSGQEFSTGENI
ncbi:MAG: YtxH domain-containing protein [Bacteroidota bacterium]